MDRPVIGALLWIVLLTLTPTLELRASIPYAMLVARWPWWMAGLVGVAANTALAPLAWVLMDRVVGVFRRIPLFDRWWTWYAEKKRISLQGYVDRYGVLGLAVFIGVPLPGTGVYSGAVAAYLLNYRFRDYLVASFLGCLMAGVIVTAVVASGNQALTFLIKPVE